MKQFVEIQLCQQADCKKFITMDCQNKLILRCQSCHLKLLSKEYQKKVFIKKKLQKQKDELIIQLNQVHEQNTDKWNMMVQLNTANILVYQIKERIIKLQDKVKQYKKILSGLQEVLEDKQKQHTRIEQQSREVEEEYYRQENPSILQQQKIMQAEERLQKRQYLIFCQLPYLFDNHLPYQFYKINEEIVETIYDDFLTSMSFDFLDRTMNFRSTLANKEICLTLKKGIEKWEDFFNDNLQYYENFIYSIMNVYKLIYYIAKLFDIVLPYGIYIDNRGHPQFLLYEIFIKQQKSSIIEFKYSSLTQMQINIYYVKYYLRADLQDKLYSFFDIIDLLQSCHQYVYNEKFQELDHLLTGYCENNTFFKEKRNQRKPIPIKLAQIGNPKFMLQREFENDDDQQYDSDDVEIINYV